LFPFYSKLLKKGVECVSNLVYDENSLVDSQMYKYDAFLHSRINKYTGNGRTKVVYYSINDPDTTTSLGFEDIYQVLGPNSPLRFDKIENMFIIGLTPLAPQEGQASTTTVRNYGLEGEGFIIPNTVMPKENDFFLINHIHMNHLFRVTQVTQDGLNTDGSYRIAYKLFSTNPIEINNIEKQIVGEYVMDLQTIGGEDLTPVIGKEDYELRSRLIKMTDDMVENYIARYYDKTHNCFILHLNGQSLFDMCGNYFMAKHSIMIRDNTCGNIVLNPDKCRDPRLDSLYQKSPYKWIERDAPLRYLDTFKYHTMKGYSYVDSSFALYGTDVDVMIPNDPWCNSPSCQPFFPQRVFEIFDNEQDIRTCDISQCRHCDKCHECYHRHYQLKRYDYVSIIHDFIHGRLTDIHKLSLYTGDQLFDNADAVEIYLWTPIIIYIIKHTLKLK
jgi:hypothetical protein